ncbi:MAG: DUF262 and DUF1524 domain-containing protein, partial [Alteraurantiacibacter sp. bin_em_oilr2.035]|nr:DUF262 and DUF1524 domain-containing protein [Alteraurantiacibacter sp. bin_em_oilr2.035]
MEASDRPFTELLDGAKQFIIPIFQRDYSWGTMQCLQLWKDIERVGGDPEAKAHFIGSIVYIAAEENSASIPRWLVIDGQQRLTTLTLLLLAFRRRLLGLEETVPQSDDEEGEEEGPPSPEEVDDYYLRNRHGKGARRYKLHLRRKDHDTLAALLDGNGLPDVAAERVYENVEFFLEQLENADLERIYDGIKKLVVVDVCLTRGQDDPQMIFESLNSTGLDLTQADLIRNFVLMDLDEPIQKELYEGFWEPMEQDFGKTYAWSFDRFVRDYLMLQLKPTKQLKSDEIYYHFRSFFREQSKSVDLIDVLGELKRFARYYVNYNRELEPDDELRNVFQRLRKLVEVGPPLMMRLYDCYDRLGTLSQSEFVEAVEVLESHIFRRSVCDMQTRSLGQIFANLAYRIEDERPLVSLKVALRRQAHARRFPSDTEFLAALKNRDVYDMRQCFFLLDRLENAGSNEKIDTSNFSIEHVMPQNKNLRSEWKAMLGEDWEQIQQTWLHRLGNVTLTGYNTKYSDRPFEDKKTIDDGFSDSPLRLNKYIRNQGVWTETQIQERGEKLAARALAIWPALEVDEKAVKDAELKDQIAKAEKHSIEKLKFDDTAKALFDQIRPRIMALGEDEIHELPTAKTLTYRVYDCFLEVFPRNKRLLLSLNIDFEDCDDPTGHVEDGTKWSFIPNATEPVGALYSIRGEGDIDGA